MADIATQEQAFRLLKQGARLLYTSAAGQPVQLDDVNGWFEQYNQLVGPLELGDTFGAIGERSNDADPLIDEAAALLRDLANRAIQARDDFGTAVDNVRTPS